MAAQVPLLRLENVGKEFYGNRVLNNVNFSLNKGEIVGLVGENGAGKSTLMKILFGMSVIHETGGYEGKIYLEGKEVKFANSFQALDAGVGMVHQEFSLIPGFSASENILLNMESMKYNYMVELFGERIMTLDREQMRQRSLKAIGKLGVDIDPNMLISEMPVGHRQFTEIARELDRDDTKLLVFDEPTAVLTETEAEILLHALRRLASEGMGIIFISHRLHEIIEVCDKIIVLRDGNVIREAPTKETNVRQIASWMVGRHVEDKDQTPHRSKPFGNKVLKIEHLWVDMPGETVRDVNLEVYEGEIFGVGGLAGQGKLGISNGIMGLHPAGGKVLFGDKVVPLNQPRKALDMDMAFVSEDRRGVGLLLEEPIDWNIVFTAMQVQEKYLHSYLGGLVEWRDDSAIRECAARYIKSLEIKCVSGRQRAQELSGGNQQKICLAKAFEVKPRLLFVAEPTRGIDVGAKRLVLDTIKKYNEEYGITVVMVSSELEELRSICDRIAIIDEGKVAGILPASASVEDFGILMLGVADEVKEVTSA